MGTRTVRITLAVLQEIITTGWAGDGIETVEGLPAGAELVGASLRDEFVLAADGQRPPPVLQLTFEHPSWAGPAEGAVIPELLVQLQRKQKRAPTQLPAPWSSSRIMPAEELRELLDNDELGRSG